MRVRRALIVGAVLAVWAAAARADVGPVATGASGLPKVLSAPAFPCSPPEAPANGPGWLAQMPRPQTTDVVSQLTHVASRYDGRSIGVRTYLPAHYLPGRLPTILIDSPYWSQGGLYLEEGNDLGVNDGPDTAECAIPFFLARGYAVAAMDLRGTHNSGGCPDLGGPADQQDGYTVVQWIAGQPWSDGRVGMHGYSWYGMSQIATAAARPPALKAIAPVSPSNWYENTFIGAVPFDWNTTNGALFRAYEEAPPALDAGSPGFAPSFLRARCSASAATAGDLSLDGTMTSYWKARDLPRLAGRIRVPVLTTDGSGVADLTYQFPRLWRSLAHTGAPRMTWQGNWPHGYPATRIPWDFIELRWDETWLRGHDTGMTREPPVTLVAPDGSERTSPVYPPADTSVRTLHPAGGALDGHTAGSSGYQDIFELQRDRVRTTDSARVLYTGEPLTRPLHLSGPQELDLRAAIDTTGTHFAASLFDVAPDGTFAFLGAGYLDAGHRRTVERPAVPVVAGRAETYRIELAPVERAIAAGHRLQLMIASSDGCLALAAYLATPPAAGVAPAGAPPPTCGYDVAFPGVLSYPRSAKVTVLEGPRATALRLRTVDR